MPVARMRRAEALCVFDGAPVLFGSRGDFGGIGEQSVSVRAEGAVQALQKIQIFQIPSIVNEIVRAPDLWDSVNREADALVNGQEQIEQKKRNDAGVDDGRREVGQKSSLQKVGWEPSLLFPDRKSTRLNSSHL